VREVIRIYPEIALEIQKELRWWISNPGEIDVGLIKELLDHLAQVRGHIKSFLGKRSVKELSSEAEA
jgi:hypothetical protein